MINRENFFDAIREGIFIGKLSESQVQGIESILTEWDNQKHTDLRWLAYIFATIFHETGQRMQPVKEFGGEKYLKSKKYYPYYGRDFVQTSWKYNYEKVKEFTGIDVVTNPDLIADINIAAKVAIHFMAKGFYTGKKLGDYFNDKKEDWVNARKIINGLDRADLVAGYGKTFYAILNASQATS